MTPDQSSANASSRSADPAVPVVARGSSISMTWHLARRAALVAIACVSIAGCVSEAPYNPDHLNASEVSQVGEICQSVMGLRSTEALTENIWPGDPDPSSQTNDYRRCIATLYNSLRTVAAAREASQAVRDCRAKGLAPDSSDLAVCVLSAEEGKPATSGMRLASLGVAPFLQQTRSESSDHLSRKLPREQLACAEIGLDPTQDVFASCVQGLRDVRLASFMAEGYRN